MQQIKKKIKQFLKILIEMDDFGDWVIQPNSQCIDLLDTIKLILNFNKNQLDLV